MSASPPDLGGGDPHRVPRLLHDPAAADAPLQPAQQVLLAEVRNEYNHNVSQQVYISEEVWELIKNAKEDLIVSINDAASEVGEEATSLDLSKKIFEKTMGKTVDPLAHALSELKREIQRIF